MPEKPEFLKNARKWAKENDLHGPQAFLRYQNTRDSFTSLRYAGLDVGSASPPFRLISQEPGDYLPFSFVDCVSSSARSDTMRLS